jgi:diguanylate cyclase (GGDEF)-like protein
MKPGSWHPNGRMSGCGTALQLADAEWRMRHGFPVEIVEARNDSLASLAAWLEAGGYPAVRRPVGDLGRVGSAACVRLVEVTAEASAARLAALTRRGAGEHVAVAAIVAEADEISLSKALAVGPDDLLTWPFDEEELKTRLDALQQLGRARAVQAERARTSARFAAAAGPAGGERDPRRSPVRGVADLGQPGDGRQGRRPAAADRPRVLVIGPASQHKVKVGEALARSAINYADNLEKAKGALERGGFELVVLLGTNPAARRDLLRWPELAGSGFPATLLVLDRASGTDRLDVRQLLAQLPVADRLTLPQPAELVRARMDFWLAFVRLQRRLLEPPSGVLQDLCHDGLTGLFNHGFFLEHLRQLVVEPGARRALVAIDLVNLPRLNESAGHAAVNRYLAALGPALRRHVRAEDLPAHLGGGRFAVLLDDVAPAEATRIGRRLEQLLAQLPAARAQLPPAATVTPRLTASSLELDRADPPLQQLRALLRRRRPAGNTAAAA